MTIKTTTPKKTSPTTKTEPSPKPREQRLVMGCVRDFGKMAWIFGDNGNSDSLRITDDQDYYHFDFTATQANALLEFLQDVVPLMQEAPADPTAPLVRYVP